MSEPGAEIPGAPEEIRAQAVSPFGTPLLRGRMPGAFVEELNEFVDRAIADPIVRASVDWSEELVGHLQHEIRVNEFVLGHDAGLQFIFLMARQYLKTCPNPLLGTSHGVASDQPTFRLALDQSWVNDMVEGDFNPLHFHSNCQLSCVGFLREPADGFNGGDSGSPGGRLFGCLQFVRGDPARGSETLFTVRPRVGDFWIFPSWLLHCVYPFRGRGVRRSLSANLSVSSKDDRPVGAAE
jgi:hypothetical protein